MASTVAQEGVDEELENQGRLQPAWSGLQNIELNIWRDRPNEHPRKEKKCLPQLN